MSHWLWSGSFGSFSACVFKWGLWVRVFGRGPWVGKDDGSQPLFSERYGYRKVWRFCGIKVQWLV